ncbi:hypothetical protein [Alkalicoccus saliphilus]|uniref:hypothetical protein n=1 Tax=Alkalicoccus saliphilus TaxID=200989 RepID=UPI00135C89B6|nr:hypothetical protein [Alkalicoccus saliphilus]
MLMQFPAFASSGRFPGGPASANFFLPLLGRNGSSARPISPRSIPVRFVWPLWT